MGISPSPVRTSERSGIIWGTACLTGRSANTPQESSARTCDRILRTKLLIQAVIVQKALGTARAVTFPIRGCAAVTARVYGRSGNSLTVLK
jgi:hypothetical protein